MPRMLAASFLVQAVGRVSKQTKTSTVQYLTMDSISILNQSNKYDLTAHCRVSIREEAASPGRARG
eukprot:m.151788 g.151788  ORF g.151788 m.151788 type:complete len:66 (+) comp23364_c0_seq1:1609-1806(+)